MPARKGRRPTPARVMGGGGQGSGGRSYYSCRGIRTIHPLPARRPRRVIRHVALRPRPLARTRAHIVLRRTLIVIIREDTLPLTRPTPLFPSCVIMRQAGLWPEQAWVVCVMCVLVCVCALRSWVVAVVAHTRHKTQVLGCGAHKTQISRCKCFCLSHLCRGSVSRCYVEAVASRCCHSLPLGFSEPDPV